MTLQRQLAVVTGASSGIGLELARLCAQDNYDLIIAADEPAIFDVAEGLAFNGASVTPILCDLSSVQCVEELRDAIKKAATPVDVLIASTGRGLGHGFLDQDIHEALKLAHANIDGTICLIHQVGRAMRDRRRGRILITGSIAGVMPGTFQAVYNGTRAFLDSFSMALSHELDDSGVSVTYLIPGANATNYIERAGVPDTQHGAPDVARAGYDAMLKGESRVTYGFAHKMRAAPESMLAEMHRKMAAPDSAKP